MINSEMLAIITIFNVGFLLGFKVKQILINIKEYIFENKKIQ